MKVVTKIFAIALCTHSITMIVKNKLVWNLLDAGLGYRLGHRLGFVLGAGVRTGLGSGLGDGLGYDSGDGRGRNRLAVSLEVS